MPKQLTTELIERFDNYIDEVAAKPENYGNRPITDAEEAALIRKMLQQDLVPLPNGDVANVPEMASLYDEGDDGPMDYTGGDESMPGTGGGVSELPNAVKVLIFIAFLAVMYLFLFGMPEFVSDGEGEATPTPVTAGGEVITNTQAIYNTLPSSIDDILVSNATGSRSSVPYPRSVEIISPAGAKTFLLIPVEIVATDFPCQRTLAAIGEEQDDVPEDLACWAYGSIVNYIIAVQNTGGTQTIMRALSDGGGASGRIVLRTGTSRVINYEVERVMEVSRNQSEILTQKYPGITIVLMDSFDDMRPNDRLVVQGRYDIEEDLGSWGLAGTPTPAPTQVSAAPTAASPETTSLSLGDEVVIGETTVGVASVGDIGEYRTAQVLLRVIAPPDANVYLPTLLSVHAQIDGSGLVKVAPDNDNLTVMAGRSELFKYSVRQHITHWNITLTDGEKTIDTKILRE